MVSKRTVDALRDHLHQEGHTDVPSRNDRIFDVLQEHAILKPNGEQAIWRTRVADAAGEWSHELTLLRIPRRRIWPNSKAAPEPFSGAITVVPAAKSSDASAKGETTESRTDSGEMGDTSSPITVQASPLNEEPLPPSFAPAKNKSKDQEEAHENTLDASLEQPCPFNEADPGEHKDAGEQFLTWLRAGLASDDIIVNDVRARVHVVPEGILIVSPAIFKDFAHQSNHEWNHIQKRFQKLQLHEKTPQGTNIHSYRTIGKRKKSTINGLLICDSSTLFQNTVPSPNPYLSKK